MTLAGCPLDEKISEMNEVKARGNSVGALGIVIVDNPMMAATGHRICNDCMKACIYQKQEPVDIPQVETRVLKDVLGLPWGFEIYSLLTRWNPLDIRRPLPRPPSGKKVLVVGLGPAGFTLAHHLMNDGHTVVGIDGLKIEPLPEAVAGVGPRGERHRFRPVRDVGELYETLDERVMAGFGGVAEYGITVRWDKNFLKLVRLLLERRAEFAIFGGVRFGGTLTIDNAFALGFDHIALCVGAGKPTVVPMPQRPGARRAPGLGLPDGAAAHRRRQDRQRRQPARAPAGGGDRRRPDRDRHGDGIARLLSAAGGEVPQPLRDAGRRARRAGGARRAGPPRRARSPTSSSPMAGRSAPSARRRRARDGRRGSSSCSTAGAASPSPIAAG